MSRAFSIAIFEQCRYDFNNDTHLHTICICINEYINVLICGCGQVSIQIDR